VRLKETAVTDRSDTLPLGLADTIDAFKAGCDSKDHKVADEVTVQMIKRFSDAFTAAEPDWPAVGSQILTLAHLAGRAATLYADLDDRSFIVHWVHARFALRDVKAECKVMGAAAPPVIGKHCQLVDLDTP
jgi:hypothetical protein